MGLLFRAQERRFHNRRRAAYERLFELIRNQHISESAAYSAWLFLGQLEKQHSQDRAKLTEAYSYFSNRLSKGRVAEWESLSPTAQQVSRRSFSGIYGQIKAGEIRYSEATSAYRGVKRDLAVDTAVGGWPPDGRVVGKFLEQLALLFECGIPLTDALETLGGSGVHPYLDQVIERMLNEITRQGTSLSRAMSRYPECFPSPVIALIRSGETSGALNNGLRRSAEMMEKRNRFKARVKGALSPAAIILGLGAVIVFGIVKFIIPRFIEVYDEMDLEMPALSQSVIGAVSVVNSTEFLLFMTAVIGVLVYFRGRIKQRVFDLALATPVVGRWVRVGLAKEMCDILADLHSNGVPLQRSFRILAESTQYDTQRRQMARASEFIQTEGSLSETLAQLDTVPRVVVVMAHVGEESGTLDSLFRSLAEILDEELDSSLNQLITTIEPIALTILGVGIAVLFVGLFLPIYGVIGNLG